jgi:hypothetical protein
MLKKMVRPEKVEVTGRWKNWFTMVVGDLYSSANNIVVMKYKD